MKIHPLIAGICNAVVPGLSYVLIDERKTFGWLLLIGTIACLILSFVEPAFLSKSFFVSTTTAGQFLEVIWYASSTIAYGYDAYCLAKRKYGADSTDDHADLHPMRIP